MSTARDRVPAALALAVCLWSVCGAVVLVSAQALRLVHLGLVLPLTFLLYPLRTESRAARALDVTFALLAAAACAWPLLGLDAFAERARRPGGADLLCGTLLIVLVLEATRRTTGLALPLLALGALAYAVCGPWLPPPWTHRGYGLARLLGLQYMGLEGLFGVPLAVSATFLVLFTAYGAVLDRGGASRFFVDLALSVVGRGRAGPGRAVVLASFLLGGPSGSGVATALALGSIALPLLRRAGYDRDRAGALLAAGGVGAVLSPPVMGAASFLIAELARVSYLEVLRWALLPTALYYLSILLVVEGDARAPAAPSEEPAPPPPATPPGVLLRANPAHLANLASVVAFLAAGFSAERAALLALLLALALGWLRRETALGPRAVAEALSGAGRAVVPVATTCATAGLLGGVVNLTGLGLKLSGILLDLAGGQLVPTLLLAALALLVLGLALPITASYLIAAVVTAPALVAVGVSEPAAHLFIFFYALLSEVSPPTALSCVAVSALTGGSVWRTTWQSWRYALPAFLVPFLFALPGGERLLLIGPPGAVALTVLTALGGGVALASSLSAGRAAWARVALGAAGVLLLAPSFAADAAGALLLLVGLAGRPQPSAP